MEEPFEPDEYEAYAELADAVDIRVTAGEQDATWWGFRELIERAHVDLVQPDVTRCGGITETLRIAELAHSQGKETVPHAWKSGIIKAASLHCNAVMPGRDLAGVLRRRHADRQEPDRPASSDRRRRVRRGADRARARRRPRRGCARKPQNRPVTANQTEERPMSSTAADTQAHLAARAAAVIPGGVNSGQRQVAGLEDLVIASTSGSTFTDGTGRIFTDYHAAFGPPLLGHNDPDVDAAVAAVGRTVDLMGIGVSQVEVELAEKLVHACAVAREGAAHLDRERGDVPCAPRLARGDRPPARDQVPGLLPRLARLGRDERDLAGREGRAEGPALAGDPPRGDRRDDRVPIQRRRRGRAGARASTTSPRSSSS